MKKREVVDYKIAGKSPVISTFDEFRKPVTVTIESLKDKREQRFFLFALSKIRNLVKPDGTLTKEYISIRRKELLEKGLIEKVAWRYVGGEKDGEIANYENHIFIGGGILVKERGGFSVGTLFPSVHPGKRWTRVYLNEWVDWYFLVNYFLESVAPPFIFVSLSTMRTGGGNEEH